MPYADPDRARGYQREYRRTRRAGDPRTTPVPLPLRPRTAANGEAGAREKAPSVGYLAGPR